MKLTIDHVYINVIVFHYDRLFIEVIFLFTQISFVALTFPYVLKAQPSECV